MYHVLNYYFSLMVAIIIVKFVINIFESMSAISVISLTLVKDFFKEIHFLNISVFIGFALSNTLP